MNVHGIRLGLCRPLRRASRELLPGNHFPRAIDKHGQKIELAQGERDAPPTDEDLMVREVYREGPGPSIS